MARRLFRTRRNLQHKSGIVGPGSLIWLDKPQEVIDKLLAVGAIGVVHCPPLGELPGFEEQAHKLEAAGIQSMEELLNASSEDLALALELSIEIVEQWKEEATSWLRM